MSITEKYKVQFEEDLPSGGDYTSCSFRAVREPDGKEQWIRVDIDTRHLEKELGITDIHPRAGKAVELHLLREVPAYGYREYKETIFLSTSWYPIEGRDDWKEFEVIPPKPGMGFKTPSN